VVGLTTNVQPEAMLPDETEQDLVTGASSIAPPTGKTVWENLTSLSSELKPDPVTVTVSPVKPTLSVSVTKGPPVMVNCAKAEVAAVELVTVTK